MENFGQIRKEIKSQREITAAKSKDDSYRLDRVHASEYFSIHPKWKEKIIAYFQELHKKGEKVVHIDICGRANGKSLGADESYLFSLKAGEIRKLFSSEDVHFIDGDIFNSRDFAALVDVLQKNNASPALVTFEPVAGLQDYLSANKSSESNAISRKVVYGQLEDRLEKIIKILKPGGYVLIERPFQFEGIRDFFQRKPQNQYEISLEMKKLARRLKCKIEIASEISGPYFLIHKNP